LHTVFGISAKVNNRAQPIVGTPLDPVAGHRGVSRAILFGEVLGLDAPYHARAALAVLDGGLLYRDVPFTYPPLYAYTQALAIALLGNTGIGWKAVAQAYDLGSIVLIWLIASRSFGRRAGLFAAALYGFSPLPLLATSCFRMTTAAPCV
jgi:hypothetical protein